MNKEQALAEARDAIKHMGTELPERLSGLYTNYAHLLVTAFVALDDAGVFAAVDEEADTGRALAMLAEQPRETGHAAVSRLGSLERVPGTDVIRPVRQGALPEPEEVADEWAARARAIEGLIPKGSGAPVCRCGADTDRTCTC